MSFDLTDDENRMLVFANCLRNLVEDLKHLKLNNTTKMYIELSLLTSINMIEIVKREVLEKKRSH